MAAEPNLLMLIDSVEKPFDETNAAFHASLPQDDDPKWFDPRREAKFMEWLLTDLDEIGLPRIADDEGRSAIRGVAALWGRRAECDEPSREEWRKAHEAAKVAKRNADRGNSDNRDAARSAIRDAAGCAYWAASVALGREWAVENVARNAADAVAWTAWTPQACAVSLAWAERFIAAGDAAVAKGEHFDSAQFGAPPRCPEADEAKSAVNRAMLAKIKEIITSE